MRSISFTVMLAALAGIVFGAIGWQSRQGNLNAVFGTPPVPLGQRLYSDFHAADISGITVAANNVKASFIKTEHGWVSEDPPRDRMDPRYALAIIAFTLNLNVQDHTHVDFVDRRGAGLRDDGIQIRLKSASGGDLARYRLGFRTPLASENKDADSPDPTVFIRPRETPLKDYVYACTGDITPLFKEAFKYLRDHRPFYFNPQALRKIRLRGAEGELTLGRENPQAPWRIVKPLDLRTDPAAAKFLIEGLFELKAVKVSDRSSITLPATETSAKNLQVAITSFGRDSEALLEIYPPASADAREVLATVSDRPDTVFHLPLKPEPGFVSFAALPVTVNDLRDHTLTNLNIASLRAVSIKPATGKRILVTRTPPSPWETVIDGKVQEANEQRLFDLLKSLTTARAIGFESDAATDFTPWGLHKPFLSIELSGENNEGFKLNFGMDGRGGVFVNRHGTPVVMRVDEALLKSISIQPHEWRHARLWSVSTVDLYAIVRTVKSEPPLTLIYDFNNENWKAEAGRTDVTARLDPQKAGELLESLVDLHVTRWLAPDDPLTAALATPLFTLNVIEKTVDEAGNENGIEGRSLVFSAIPDDPGVFIGKLDTEPHPFLLDRAAFLKIAVDPLEQ